LFTEDYFKPKLARHGGCGKFPIAFKMTKNQRKRENGRQDEEEFFLVELTELSAFQGCRGDSWKAKVLLN